MPWNDKIVVIGGSRDKFENEGQGTIDLKSVELYNPNDNNPSNALPEMNFPRKHHSCSIVELPDGQTGIF